MDYEFKCKKCGSVYDFPSSKVDYDCCGVQVSRVYSLGGVVLKGTGWYSKDHTKDKG